MYLVVAEDAVDRTIAEGRWQEARLVGRDAAAQIRALPDPERYWVLSVTGRVDGLCRVARADRFVAMTPEQALLGADPAAIFSGSDE